MNRLLAIILFLLVSFSVIGQNDSVSYSYTSTRKKVRALLFNDSPINYSLNLESEAHLFEPAKYIISAKHVLMHKPKDKVIRQSYKHWRFGVLSGFGLGISPISSKLSDGIIHRKKNLRKGFFIDFDGGHFITENIGVGGKYSLFIASSDIENFIGKLPHFDNLIGKVSDKVTTHYFGPALFLRSISRNRKIIANCDFSLGYIIYNNKNVLTYNLFEKGMKYNMVGGNFGFSTTVGVDFMLGQHVALGLNFGVMAASITDVKVNGQKISFDKDYIENLSRVNFGASLRLYK